MAKRRFKSMTKKEPKRAKYVFLKILEVSFVLLLLQNTVQIRNPIQKALKKPLVKRPLSWKPYCEPAGAPPPGTLSCGRGNF
jgi:hypothetical protein